MTVNGTGAPAPVPVTPQAICRAIEALMDENDSLKRQLARRDTPSQTNRKKLTKREVELIRKMKRDTDLSNRAIAESFDINNATVSRIVRGHYHK